MLSILEANRLIVIVEPNDLELLVSSQIDQLRKPWIDEGMQQTRICSFGLEKNKFVLFDISKNSGSDKSKDTVVFCSCSLINGTYLLLIKS